MMMMMMEIYVYSLLLGSHGCHGCWPCLPALGRCLYIIFAVDRKHAMLDNQAQASHDRHGDSCCDGV